MNELTSESEFIDKTLKQWLQSVTIEQRGKFWMAMFEILSSTDAETLSQISDNWFVSSKKFFTTYKSLDEDSKEIISQTLKSLFNIVKGNIKPGKNER